MSSHRAGHDPAAAARASAGLAGPPAAVAGTDEAVRPTPTLRESVVGQLGGWRGLVESGIPVAVFVVVNVVAPLKIALWAAVAGAVLIAVGRLAVRRPVRYALNGLVGVLVAAGLAAHTGRARDFYLPGILLGLAYGLAGLVSVLARWPLVGVVWSFLDGSGSTWRQDRRLRRTYVWLTLVWSAVFAARVAVQGALYLTGHVSALGVARLAMGYPLFGLALLVTLWAGRRAHPPAVSPPGTRTTVG